MSQLKKEVEKFLIFEKVLVRLTLSIQILVPEFFRSQKSTTGSFEEKNWLKKVDRIKPDSQ